MSVTVSHRPFPRLPGEVGMARETRALPGSYRRPHHYFRDPTIYQDLPKV